MSSEDFMFLVLFAGSMAIALDYGRAGKFLFDIARSAGNDGRPQPLIRGMGWMLFTTVSFNWFWIIILIISSAVTIPPLLIAAAYALLVSAAIVGRWRWWRQITPAVKNGHRNEAVPPDETP